MSQRIEKLNSVFQKDIADYAVKQSRNNAYIVTITYVNVSADISHARVGVTTFPCENSFINQAIHALQRNKQELQLKLARGHKLKNIPVISFASDPDNQTVNKIEQLLQEVNNERS